jgi:hypothetical protein
MNLYSKLRALKEGFFLELREADLLDIINSIYSELVSFK